MLVYHGSPEIVTKPSIKKCRPYNDYGPGFYCTLSKTLACEWACNRPGVNGFCNTYDLDLSKLTVLDLDEHENGVLAWLAVLMQHRIFDMEWGAQELKDAFIAQYAVDLSGTDVVCGYRADDSYFSIARAFINGVITDVQAAEALRLGDLGRQIVPRSAKAFKALRFLEAESLQGSAWYAQWVQRDQAAREAFFALRQQRGKASGKRIFDLVEE